LFGGAWKYAERKKGGGEAGMSQKVPEKKKKGMQRNHWAVGIQTYQILREGKRAPGRTQWCTKDHQSTIKGEKDRIEFQGLRTMRNGLAKGGVEWKGEKARHPQEPGGGGTGEGGSKKGGKKKPLVHEKKCGVGAEQPAEIGGEQIVDFCPTGNVREVGERGIKWDRTGRGGGVGAHMARGVGSKTDSHHKTEEKSVNTVARYKYTRGGGSNSGDTEQFVLRGEEYSRAKTRLEKKTGSRG